VCAAAGRCWQPAAAVAGQPRRAQTAPRMSAAPRTDPWPRVYLIGAQKAATTSLSSVFDKVGLCGSSLGKESHYFTSTPPVSGPLPQCLARRPS
jgi:hypothetical protein